MYIFIQNRKKYSCDFAYCVYAYRGRGREEDSAAAGAPFPMSWVVLVRALLLGVLLLLDAGRRGHAASHDKKTASTAVPMLIWRLPGNEEGDSARASKPQQSAPSGSSGGAQAVAEVGKPGKIVLLSAGQLLNDTGEYRVSGDERVRKAAGFEIAYDYYFKPQDPPVPTGNFKNMTKKTMPTVLASAFLVILVLCIVVCLSGICWERTRRFVVSGLSSGGGAVGPDLSRNAAAGDSGGSTYGHDKFMI